MYDDRHILVVLKSLRKMQKLEATQENSTCTNGSGCAVTTDVVHTYDKFSTTYQQGLRALARVYMDIYALHLSQSLEK